MTKKETKARSGRGENFPVEGLGTDPELDGLNVEELMLKALEINNAFPNAMTMVKIGLGLDFMAIDRFEPDLIEAAHRGDKSALELLRLDVALLRTGAELSINFENSGRPMSELPIVGQAMSEQKGPHVQHSRTKLRAKSKRWD